MKEIHKIIDLAENTFRRPSKNGMANLSKGLYSLSEKDFRLLCAVYQVGRIYVISPNKENWENLKSEINEMSLEDLTNKMISRMMLDQLLEMHIVRGLGTLQKAGILKNTGVNQKV